MSSRVRSIASGQKPRIGKPRASSGVTRLGKIPYAGWTSLREDLGDALPHRQQLAPVAAGAPVDRREHVLVAVVEQRDHRAAGVERRADRLRVDRAGVVHLEEGLGEDLPVAVERRRACRRSPAAARRPPRGAGAGAGRATPTSGTASSSRLTKCHPPQRSQRTGGRPRSSGRSPTKSRSSGTRTSRPARS